MNAKILIISMATMLVGGCAWIRDQPYYIPGGAYVRDVWVSHGGYRVDNQGRRYYERDGRRYYDRDYRRRGDTPANRALNTLQREAHEEREFIMDVGRAQMNAAKEAANMQMKAAQAQANMQMKAAQAAVKAQQQAANMQMKAAQAAAKAKQQATKAQMKAAAKMLKR